MKILMFLHGTTIMHKKALGLARKEIVKQVISRNESVYDYASYVPIGDAVEKLWTWKNQGAEISYLSSHETAEDVKKDKAVLGRYNFPDGPVYFRQGKEQYKDIAERIIPDVLIEDDCESIGGEKEMVYPRIRPELKKKIKSIVIREFDGIDRLPDQIARLKVTKIITKQNGMNLRICQFQEGEAKELSKMINKVVDQMEKANPELNYRMVRDEDTPQELIKASKRGQTWVAKSGHKIVGTVSLIENRLRRFFVYPDFQRRGIGRILINTVVRYAKSKGLREIRVGALLDVVPIYKKLGFSGGEIFLNPEINLKEMEMKLA